MVDDLSGLAVANIGAAAVTGLALVVQVVVVSAPDNIRFAGVKGILHLAVGVEVVAVACHLASQGLARSWFAYDLGS
jgi:hypothetical protein